MRFCWSLDRWVGSAYPARGVRLLSVVNIMARRRWVVVAGKLLGLAAVGVFVIIRRYLELNPVQPPSEAARAAGRRWEAEIEERQSAES